MDSLRFIEDHNKVGYLTKDKHSTGFEEIVDFLASSSIVYAATINPTIYVNHMKDFWANATIEESDRVKTIHTTICGLSLIVTPSKICHHLRLNDESGITMLFPLCHQGIFLKNGYAGPQNSLKYQKGKFCPQWRFFVHTLLHCFSRETTSWSEFSGTIASALVCLSTQQVFNFSQMIFDDLVYNHENMNNANVKSFYMFPRFVQEVKTQELTDVPTDGNTNESYALNSKVFSNMKRPAKGSNDIFTPLFSTMMGVNPPQGDASGLQPSQSSIPTDDLPPPSTTNIPQFLDDSTPTPSLKHYTRKNRGAPSSSGSKPSEPLILPMEDSPSDSFQRDTHGVMPHSSVKKVPSKEIEGHVDGVAQTTNVAHGVYQESLIIAKTPSMATPGEKSSGGPRCQETKGAASASARLKTSAKILKDPVKEVKTSKPGEDLACIAKDLKAHDANFHFHEKRHDSHEERLDMLENMIDIQNKLIKSKDAMLADLTKCSITGNEFYCFLDGYSGYNQIHIAPEDQEKTTFTCAFGTFAFRRMPFGLCNALATFQRCMMAIFTDMIEDTIEVFMDDFSFIGSSFEVCLENLEKSLVRCETHDLVQNWEKCHFMVQEGTVLGHLVSKRGLEVDKAKTLGDRATSKAHYSERN
ncbi:LOW QUALITY PROTEIN: hypothetical protein OSB04_024489 [Centaurea solstitialis]|uniref:Reverse transcriptase domain-containing protein n=1 Tax=Centaurea solstitialis TaxID=347529 RepID=A0AA38T4N9_9ASTR|nr:LOW QUALITY PROTEIN: hypothetical protein OSB04_024489 [Centaurea solstitialis]